MRSLGGLVLAIALILPEDAALAAARPVELEIQLEGKLPFSKRDLAELLRMRLPLVPPDAGKVKAVLRTPATDTVVIEVAGKTRETQLVAGDPLASARLVALLLLDLVSDEVAEPVPAPTPSVVASARPRRDPRVVLSFAPVISFRVRDSEVGFDPSITVQVRLIRHLSLWADLGYSWTPSRENLWTSDLRIDQMVVRLGLAPQWRWFQLLGGLVLRPYWVKWQGRPPEKSGTVFGFTVGLRANVVLGGPVSLFGVAAMDIMTKEVVFSYQDGSDSWTSMRTNLVVPWLGIGLSCGI